MGHRARSRTRGAAELFATCGSGASDGLGKRRRPYRGARHADAVQRQPNLGNRRPERYSPDDIAAALARALVRDVSAEAVPRAGWDPLFRAQGMRNPLPRIQMLDGFNNGDFRFRDDGKHALRGGVTLVEAIAALVRES
ncbi:hypothetical protein [Pandoraea sp. XY-2]|uniref:hypothetical protein n=1 Tax=Pandoraea sp. XY-2 TaxID=2518599 RepID=UPI001F0CFCBB|nr:hypothetical protein [Pandoraea sp. XY-2]